MRAPSNAAVVAVAACVALLALLALFCLSPSGLQAANGPVGAATRAHGWMVAAAQANGRTGAATHAHVATEAPDRASASTQGFRGSIHRIGPQLRQRMTGVSWRPGCPVGFAQLRLLKVRHWGFDGKPRRGRVVVHRAEARAMLGVMRRLYRLRFPIRRMRLIDAYGADDRRSMAADNTSAFNCRFVAGTSRWSEHAYGRAIDVNPIENPYVGASGYVSPPAGAPYRDRSRRARGVIHRRGPVVAAFAAAGWQWGGNWSWPKDYQHFSATGG